MAYATPLFVSSATPFFRSFATRTFATPKNLSFLLEGVVDKEMAKLVEEVNKVLVMDMVLEGWLTIGDQGGGGVQHGACHGCGGGGGG